MSIDFQRLERVRAARRSARRKRWVRGSSTLAMILALAAVGQRVASREVPVLSHGAALVGQALGEARGRVHTVEPAAGLVRIASGFLGLLSVELLVTPDTLIVVGDKEGGFGDLREGEPVVATYEIHSDTLRARRVELIGRDLRASGN